MAHQILELEALPREKAGKGSARAARRNGLVPAVIYGAKEPPRLINLRRNALIAILNRGGFLSHQFEIKLPDGKSERVLPRDVQLHPVTDMPIHVDFLRLAKGTRVEVEVPVQFVNEREAPGIRRGGVLTIVRHEIELEVPADNIPEFIEVDLTGLNIGDAVKISSVKLPEGARPTITDRDFTIATITAPSGMQVETGEGEAEGEAEQAAAPAESEARKED